MNRYPTISRDNNFDIVRLFAAFEVCIGHVLTHFNIGGGHIVGFPGVIIFFTLSGFLVTLSWCRNNSLKQFVRNRFLRIYPALFVCFIALQIIMVVLGHIKWENLLDWQLWAYWIGQLTIGQFFTPDFLRDFGVGCPNGSLWTIPIEIEFYLLIPLIFIVFSKIKIQYKYLAAGILSILINIVLGLIAQENDGHTNANELIQGSSIGHLLTKLSLVSVMPYLYCFIAGGLIYLYWDKIKGMFVNRLWIWLPLYLLLIWWSDYGPGYQINNWETLFFNLMLGCVAISAAFSLGNTYKILMGFDISYGIYIIHMIIVNVFLEIGHGNSITDAVICIILTIGLAILLNKYVERPALRMKTSSNNKA